jgi:CheY-like chemotaxis protein
MLKEDRVAVNILVADDSVTMRRILELTFQGEDASVTTVENGEAALRKASEMTPDIVFADLSSQGQGMDGYALATAIKSQSGLERTAVVVMASQKHPYDEEKGKAAGVDDHIIKPFDTANVIERVKQVLSKPRVAPGRGAAAAAPAPSVGRPAAAAPMGSKTIAFGKPPQPANAAQAAQAASPGAPPAVATGGGGRPAHAAAAAVAQKQPMAAPAAAPAAAPVSAAVVSASADLERKIGSLGLTAEQAAAVLALSREVVERVVWEIVPDLAEALIKEEIRRLTTG